MGIMPNMDIIITVITPVVADIREWGTIQCTHNIRAIITMVGGCSRLGIIMEVILVVIIQTNQPLIIIVGAVMGPMGTK